MKERVKIFWYYVKSAFKRWTGPRVYVVQYAYTDKNGIMKYDAHVVRAVEFTVRDVVAYLQQQTPGKNLIILGISEVPGAVYNGPVIDKAAQFVSRVDQIADAFTLAGTKPVQEEEEEEEEEDDDTASRMLG